MYEENLKPLPTGDASVVFADVLDQLQQRLRGGHPPHITAENVVEWARPEGQPYLACLCRRLLLPGSRLEGFENLADLAQLARLGESCLLCLNHRSNLDVPTLFTLVEDQADASVFQKIIWIAGRKLSEDRGLTPLMVQCFHRVVVTPKSWLKKHHSERERHEAQQVNRAAHRAIHTLRRQGWIFALFPAGTRARSGDKSTVRAIEETDSYLKNFDWMVLCHIGGCTLPVTRNHDLTRETPTLDRMAYTFSPILQTQLWRAEAAIRFAHESQRDATAKALMEDIAKLGAGLTAPQ